MGKFDAEVRVVEKLVKARPGRVCSYFDLRRVSSVHGSANKKTPKFTERADLGPAEGLNFPEVDGVERLADTIEGNYEDHGKRCLEGDEGNFNRIECWKMGKSCEGRNFSEMRMAMPPHGGIGLESVRSEKVVFEKAGVAFIVQLGFTQENYVKFMFVQE